MKKKVNGIIVVEGTSDVSFLSTFLEAEFVTTNGSEIPQKNIEYLKKSAENRDIFVLTDPDSPGKRIRDILDQNIPNLKHCFIDKNKSIKKNKVGVAESTKEEVLTALSKYIDTSVISKLTITSNDLVQLGLLGGEGSFSKRKKICDKFHLGFCNGKTFLKRINYSNLSIEDIKSSL